MARSTPRNHANGGKLRFLVNLPKSDLPRNALLVGEDNGRLESASRGQLMVLTDEHQCGYFYYILGN